MPRMKGKGHPAEPETPATTWRGLRRALSVLEHLSIEPGRAVDVTRALELPWATAYRTLSQLEKAGFLKRDAESNRYEIGPRLWFIGTAYVANHRVLRMAMPYLHRAEQIPGIAVQLAERSGRQSVNVFSAQPLAEEITKATYGYHFPLHCGSKGWVLLAYAEPRFLDAYLAGRLERLTPNTITDPAELRRELDRVRENGYAVTIGDVQVFTGSVAAPIFDQHGTAVAALTYIAEKSAVQNGKRRARLLDSLLKAAQSTSIALGWRPGVLGD